MNDLERKTVLITGGTGGIGWATAKAFAEKGANVVVTDIKPPSEPDSRILFLKGDVTIEEEVSRVVAETVNHFSTIDILFNNVGIGANWDHNIGKSVVMEGLTEFKVENFNFILATNLISAALFAKHAIPHIPKNAESCIITSSSVYAHGKIAGALAYGASKAGLINITMQIAQECAPVRGVAIAWGAVNTPMMTCNSDGMKQAYEDTLIGMYIEPEEAAEHVLHVAASPSINAVTLSIDGGSRHR